MDGIAFSRIHLKILHKVPTPSHIFWLQPEFLSANYFAIVNPRYLCEGNHDNLDECHVQSYISPLKKDLV